MSLAAATKNQGALTRGLYEKLEDRILARDQIGASECYYDLVLDGRPLAEMLREAVRIHGPYTHVPYHERIDDGFVGPRSSTPDCARRAQPQAPAGLRDLRRGPCALKTTPKDF